MKPGITLFVDPVTSHYENDRLFEPRSQWMGGDTVLEPYRYLKEWLAQRGVSVHTADALERGEGLGEKNVYISLGSRQRYPRIAARGDAVLGAFIAMECPAVEPRLYAQLHTAARSFRRIYSFSTSEALRPFLTEPVEVLPFHIPQSWNSVHEEIWARDGRSFLTMINTNKLPRDYRGELYTERLRAIEFFASSGEIDLYGVGWNEAPFQVGQTWVPRSARLVGHRVKSRWYALRPPHALAAARSVYRGELRDKASTLGNYRFALVIENQALERWITEKIFDCFYTGTVPVYLGAPDVERWIPPECYVDMRAFGSYAELRDHLRSLTDRDVQGYREAARYFLDSDAFTPFSKRAHAEVFGRIVEDETGVALAPEKRDALVEDRVE